MENLCSNKPRRHPNTRLSGFTPDACCKSGELLLITGRSYSKARLKTTHKQDEGWEEDAVDQGGGAGIEPAALTFCLGAADEIQLFEHSRRWQRRGGRDPEWNDVN